MRRSTASVTAVGLAACLAHLVEAVPPGGSPYDAYRNRSSITLAGTARDFTPAFLPGGHADFGKAAADGSGRYINILGTVLDSSGRPVFNSTGYKRSVDWTDAALRPIISPKSYISTKSGDVGGVAAMTSGGTVANAGTVAQWYQDVAGVNAAYPVQITMGYSGGRYIYDGTLDGYRSNGTSDYSYSCTFSTPFVYEAGNDWYFAVSTGADAWVYIDDKLVIDAGGGTGYQGIIGVAASGAISLANTGQIDVAAGSSGSVSTNATGAASVSVVNGARILTNVYAGPGAVPATAISANPAAITGTRGALSTAVAMPVIDAPSGMPASLGNQSYVGATVTFNSNKHFNDLSILGGSTINISGNIIILVDGAFTLRNSSKMVLLGNSTCEFYFRGSWFSGQTAEINVTTADPARFTFYNLGTSLIDVNNTTEAYANFASPNAAIGIGNAVHVRGNFIGKSLAVNNTGIFTIQGTSAWGHFHGSAAVDASQRIDLDRLAWLDPLRSHMLRVFTANRTGRPSHLHLESNMTLVRVAALPTKGETD